MTKDKAESAKAYIEKKYMKLKNEEKERKEGKRRRLTNRMGYAAEEDAETKSE